MAFEIIERSVTRNVKTDPSVSVTTLGRLTFNKPVTEMLLRVGVKKVFLLWDDDAKAIGLQIAPANDRRAYSVSHNPSKSNSSVSARVLFDKVKIDYKQTTQIPVAMHEGQDIPVTFGVPPEIISAV